MIAVIGIDLQVAYASPHGALARSGVDVSLCAEAAERAEMVLAAARAAAIPVVLTQKMSDDRYPTGLSFGAASAVLIENGGLSSGSPDSELLPGVRTSGDIVIEKLGFSAFSNTRLESTLRALSVERLLIVGLTTAICVESTVRGAADSRFDVTVVADAVAEPDPDRHERALASMSYAFASLTSAANVVDDFRDLRGVS